MRRLLLTLLLLPTLAIAQQTSTPPPSAKMTSLEAANAKLLDWPQLNVYKAANAALPPTAPGRVVFFGDSITQHWGEKEGVFFPGKPYLNRGISGQTTPQMVIRFRQDVINLHPTAVVILAGTNDIAGNTGPETPEMIQDNLRSMVELARANKIRVILASVPPSDDFPWRKGLEPAQKIVALNRWIAEYCKQQKLTYIDYYTPMATTEGAMKPGLSKDGVHPTLAGYAIMAPLVEAAINKKH